MTTHGTTVKGAVFTPPMRSLLLMLLVLAGCAHPPRVARAAKVNEPSLEVMTFNVNFGIPGDAATVALIEQSTAALVVLQETTPAWEAATRAALSKQWPHQQWVHSAGAGGLAVLSTRPFTAKVLENEKGWFPAMHVVAESALGPVQVLAVHLRPPVSDSGSFVSGYLTTSPLRRAELGAFLTALQPGLPTLVVGDFNEGTHGDAVSALHDRGFRSVLPEFEPGAKTWGWQVGGVQLSAQLDHLVASPELEPLSASVVQGGRSDHQPVVATFVRASAGAMERPIAHGTSLSFSSAR